ncbi:MAG TPA: hypothetical protein VFI11_09630 [Anaerolineales bacterium]|nr:hypothetical protein [Anaerolineales bacterium]
MISTRKLWPVFALLAAALACSLPGTPTAPPPEPTLPPEPTAEVLPTAEMAPTDSGEPTAAPTGDVIAVVVSDDLISLYRLDGGSVGRWEAPGITWPRQGWVQVVGGSVYYVKPSTGAVAAVSWTGTTDFSFTAMPNLSAFAVSPDEQFMAWSTTSYTDVPVSQLWMSRLDGSDMRMILESDASDEIADWFVLEPVTFGHDGSLVYAWQITGIGGYILFGGYSSLYRYDPATGTSTPMAALVGDSTGPCWGGIREDLAFVAGHCVGADGTMAMRERNVLAGTENVFPEFPDQGQAGAAVYSPSGNRLAYAIARSNQDDEAGQIIVRMSPEAAPASIASITDGYFRILFWLDESQLLVGGMEAGQDQVYLVQLDGTRFSVAPGVLAGWMRLP